MITHDLLAVSSWNTTVFLKRWLFANIIKIWSTVQMYEDGGKFVVQTRFVATYSFTCWSISTRYNKSPLVALLCLYSLFYKTLDMGWISCMQYECPINSPRLDRAALASVLAGRVNLGSIIVLTIFHFSCCNHCQVHYLNCMGILHEFWYNNGKFITP